MIEKHSNDILLPVKQNPLPKSANEMKRNQASYEINAISEELSQKYG